MDTDPAMLRLLAVIPARGGSKGIPRKNVKEFLGRPLLAWTVDVAKASKVFERVIVSTDDQDIAAIGRACGAEVPFLRPGYLAEDTAPTAPVIHHAVDWLHRKEQWLPDFVMVLEPTSPSRRIFHLQAAARLLRDSGADSLASVSTLPHHYHPAKALRLHSDGGLTGVDGTPVREMRYRRQDLPDLYAFNGLIFAAKTSLLFESPPALWGKRVIGYVTAPQYSIDIDMPEDWVTAEARMEAILAEETAQ